MGPSKLPAKYLAPVLEGYDREVVVTPEPAPRMSWAGHE
jgi:hypothetical protein